jgi:hypothetical protein
MLSLFYYKRGTPGPAHNFPGRRSGRLSVPARGGAWGRGWGWGWAGAGRATRPAPAQRATALARVRSASAATPARRAPRRPLGRGRQACMTSSRRAGRHASRAGGQGGRRGLVLPGRLPGLVRCAALTAWLPPPRGGTAFGAPRPRVRAPCPSRLCCTTLRRGARQCGWPCLWVTG